MNGFENTNVKLIHRIIAAVIDYIVFCVVYGWATGILILSLKQYIPKFSLNNDFTVIYIGMIILAVVVYVLYFSIFESSNLKGGLGKKAFGLEVTDLGGKRIKYSKAILRTFLKLIATLTMICPLIFILKNQKDMFYDVLLKTKVSKYEVKHV